MIVRANHSLIAATLALVATVALGQSTHAQTVNSQRTNLNEIPTLQDAFEDTFYGEIGDFYRNSDILGDLRDLVGPFPENSIVRDADAFHDLYREALLIQTTSDPTVRTADLVNPFDTSLQSLEPYSPPRPTPALFVPPAVQSVPGDRPPVSPSGPVRGLY